MACRVCTRNVKDGIKGTRQREKHCSVRDHRGRSEDAGLEEGRPEMEDRQAGPGASRDGTLAPRMAAFDPKATQDGVKPLTVFVHAFYGEPVTALSHIISSSHQKLCKAGVTATA